MLVLHELSDMNATHTLDIPDEDWYVTHAYNGFDTLQFELPVDSAFYPLVHEECKVTFIGSRSRDMRFIVKNIDEHSDFVTVDCDIDLDDWEAMVYESFRTTDSTLDRVLGLILPDGWSKQGTQQFAKRTTVEDIEGKPIYACTPLDILDHVTEAYGCVFNFDNINRIIYVMNPDGEKPSGEYVSDELNLTSRPGFVGNSSNFATRLYAYGKRDDDGNNPLMFGDINNGKNYVEDFSYSDKVICVGWSDERYTVKQDLLDAAKAKLADISKPTRSYSCNVAQLNYNVWMYRVVTLLDTVRNIRVDHQVVEWQEHANPVDDEVTLSAVQPSIERLVQRTLDNGPDKMREEITDAYTKAIKHATDEITGSYGGYFKWVLDADGNLMELVNLADSTDINKAQHVWRWNRAGLGHSNTGYNGTYDLAMLADGSINASMITVGILQGGNSYWNLNTGDLSLWGEFRASYVDDSSGITQTVHIDPDWTTSLVNDPDTTFDGPAIVFESSDQYKAAAIHRFVNQKYNGAEQFSPSSIEIIGGQKTENAPGGYISIGSRLDTTNGKLMGDSFMMASDDYLHDSKFRADVWTQAYDDNSKTSAGLSSADTNGSVGVEARIDNGFLYFGGYLGGWGGGRTTFYETYWTTAQTANEYAYTKYTVTVSEPAKYGLYRPFCTIDSWQDNDKYIVGTTSNASSSGWNVWTHTFPRQVVTSITATWKTLSLSGTYNVSGICQDLSINWNSNYLWSSFTYLIYTIGILGNI